MLPDLGLRDDGVPADTVHEVLELLHPLLDEVSLIEAAELLVGERGDEDDGAEFALEAFVEPVEMFVAPGYLAGGNGIIRYALEIQAYRQD